MYFSTTAVPTASFGDLYPTSDASELFPVVYVLSGFSIVATCLNARAIAASAAVKTSGNRVSGETCSEETVKLVAVDLATDGNNLTDSRAFSPGVEVGDLGATADNLQR